MPVFPIEFTAKSTVHQRQLIHVEADTVEDAIAAVESYDIDNSQATDLGKPIFSEWLVDDVKSYDPGNSPIALPATVLSDGSTTNPRNLVRYNAREIVYVTDGANVDLANEMIVEVDASIPEDQHEALITDIISDRTGWLVESLQFGLVTDGDEQLRISAPV